MGQLKRVRRINEEELRDMLENKVLELLIDIHKKKVYHVHPPIGHTAATMEYLRVNEDKINEFTAGHLVSAMVKIENRMIQEIDVGISSLELGHKIRHTHEQLDMAVAIVSALIKVSNNEVRISKNMKWVLAKAA